MWKRNTVWLTTAPAKGNSWYIYQGERSDPSSSLIGRCSTPAWPLDRVQYFKTLQNIISLITHSVTTLGLMGT